VEDRKPGVYLCKGCGIGEAVSVDELEAVAGEMKAPLCRQHDSLCAEDGVAMIDGIRRVSKPGCRVYVASNEIPKVRNGLGMAVLSTSKGVMCDRDAREQKVGGEIICEVW